MIASPLPLPTRVEVTEGPALLRGVGRGASLAAHRQQYGDLAHPNLAELDDALAGVDLRGRGGAGFPFLVKLRTTAMSRGRSVVVVNLAEGEPASAKDHALATTRPHLLLDGAVLVARALGTKEVHVVVPADRPAVEQAIRVAVGERRERFRVHTSAARFTSGQSSAVLELMAGRQGLPVTTWTPSARSGHRGRPTLLANAETWAQVALLMHDLRSYGAGTRLLTLVGTRGGHRVVEVALGSRLGEAIGAERLRHPALLGGFHGAWATPDDLATMTVSTGLGAGVVLSLTDGECPGDVTRQITRYLAGQSAGRCGPCRNGLPALASALEDGDPLRADELQRQVDGRGACAHPDGTARLVRSLLTTFPGCLRAHEAVAT
ncbi:NADH-quinone oxidoreductase subunit NuoF family protein [soil metagenome]